MIDLILIAVLLLLGFGFGRLAEKRHYASILEREEKYNALPAFASRVPPKDKVYHQHLVSGSVVVANDYFKAFVAGLRQIFGGKVRAYETLLDRGRREAMLRLKEQAKEMDADYVFCVRYETASISKGGSRLPIIEVFAYGTALVDQNKFVTTSPSSSSSGSSSGPWEESP